jgi:hypothetical protein
MRYRRPTVRHPYPSVGSAVKRRACWFAIALAVGCRSAAPVHIGPAVSLPLTLDRQYLESIPVPEVGGSYDWDRWWPRPLAIAGRYYIDGVYRESRGPCFLIW